MKSLLIFLFLGLLTVACRNDDAAPVNVCGVGDPINDLPWLKIRMEEARQRKEEHITAVRAIDIKGETLVQVNTMYMSCNICVLYHCDGRRVDTSTFSQEDLRSIGEKLSDPLQHMSLWPSR